MRSERGVRKTWMSSGKARSIRPNPASVDEAPRERSTSFRSLITDNRSPDGSGAFRRLTKGDPRGLLEASEVRMLT
jgi:hypothetical protein